jgi:hypothetical protein
MALSEPLEILSIYADKDEKLLDKVLKALKSSLAPLEQKGLVSFWDKRQIIPGTDKARVFDNHMQSARMVLLLISADFMSSDLIYSKQMKELIAKHFAGKVYVIPVLLRPVSWDDSPFGELAPLPDNEEFLSSWSSEDKALLNIAEGVKRTAKNLLDIPEKREKSADSPLAPAPADEAMDGRNTPMSYQSFTPGQIERLKRRQKQLQERLNPLNEKIEELEQAIDRVVDILVKRQYKYELEQAQANRKQVEDELDEIERQLQQ